MRMRRASALGAQVGMVWTLAALLLCWRMAPAFLDPPAIAVAALLAGGVCVGAAAGALAARVRSGTAAPALAAGAAFGAVAGAWGAVYASADAGALLAGATLAGAAAGGASGAVLARRRVRVAVASLVVVVAVGMLAARLATRPAAAAAGRVVVVGVDGGSWRVLDPLLARGELPTFARLQRDGAHGVLWSMQPSSSAVLWTTMASGRLPAEHGVHDFYATQNDDLRAARFWEVASAHGDVVGIFQWLVTWPPDPLPGFVVPGWLARDDRTHPTDLAWLKDVELRTQQKQGIPARAAAHAAARAIGDGLRLASAAAIVADAAAAARIGDGRASYRAGRYAQLALVGDVFLSRWRFHQPTVSAVVFYGSDALSHAYWKYHEPDARVPAAEVAVYGDTIREYYRRVDAFLARLVDTVGPGTTVLVVSDHGFHGAEDHQLALGSAALLEALGAQDRFTAHAINRQVYLTHRHAAAPEAAAEVGRLAAACAAMTLEGERIVDVGVDEATAQVTLVLRRGIERRDANSPVRVGERSVPLGRLVARTTWSGAHEDEGILLARGPGVPAGVRVERASILDVAPTVLAMLGHPVAEDMDGRVLAELFATPPAVGTIASWDGAIPARHAVGRADDRLDERLRALGYVR